MERIAVLKGENVLVLVMTFKSQKLWKDAEMLSTWKRKNDSGQARDSYFSMPTTRNLFPCML